MKRFMTRFLPTGLGDDQRVDVEVVIVLGVGDRRLERLLDVLGDALAREGQVGERLVDLLAADLGGNVVQLPRRMRIERVTALASLSGANADGFGLPMLTCLLAFLSPAVWPWKVRVGANSPSL
jgi:hypothetical protein